MQDYTRLRHDLHMYTSIHYKYWINLIISLPMCDNGFQFVLVYANGELPAFIPDCATVYNTCIVDYALTTF